MHSYHGVHSVLPPGKKGCCWGTWLVYVLPQLEQQPLYNAWNSCGINSPGVPAGYDLDLRYFGAANVTVTSTRLGVYLCPSDSANAPMSATINGTDLRLHLAELRRQLRQYDRVAGRLSRHPVRRRPVRGHRLARWATTDQPARATVGLTRSPTARATPCSSPRSSWARVWTCGDSPGGATPPRSRPSRAQQLVPRRALQPALLHQSVPNPPCTVGDDGPARDVRGAEPAPRRRERRHGRRLGPLRQGHGRSPDLADDEHDRGQRGLRLRCPTDPMPGESATMPTPAIDRIGPTREPRRWPVMRQKWRELLFLHWPVPPEALRPLVPPQLELDLFEGTAYVGLVPFTMTGVRPVGLPPVRGLSSFHETNVRTYVHREGRDPGVWFFSLDAANRVAVALARRPVPPSLLSRADVPGARGHVSPRRSPADPLCGRPSPARSPPGLLPHPRDPDRTGPVRLVPERSNISSSSGTSSTPLRTIGSTRARCTITPIPSNRRRSSRSTSRSSRLPASGGPIDPARRTSPGASTSRSTQSSHAT